MLVLFFLNFYSKTLFLGLSAHHVWRQADCLSISKNYFEEGMHFFSPKVHSLLAPGGNAVSELPIINYGVAVLWKIFGEHDFIYKLVDYFIFLVAIFVLFNTLVKHYNSRFYTVFMMSLLLTSPLLVYYSFNFLSDVPALSFCIMAFCFLYSFHKTKVVFYFYLSLFMGTLAVLLKASALIAMALLVFFAIIDILNLNKVFKTEKALKQKVIPTILISLSLYLVYAWYNFARNYNSFDSGIFMLTISPIWDMPANEIFANCKSLMNDLFPVFLNRPTLALFFVSQVYIIFHFRKLDAFLKYAYFFSLFFFVMYILFFFQVFSVHDYYLINLFIFPVVSFFCILHLQVQNGFSISKYLVLILGIIFMFNALFSAAHYRMNTIMKDNMLAWYPFISRGEIKYFEYGIWDYKRELESLQAFKPVLRRLGINREDVVLSLTDGGPNVALYLMDQKGFVIIREKNKNDSLCLQRLLSKNVKYLILNNKDWKEGKGFKTVEPYFESIFKKSPIEIYKLK